jgi:bifunctional DNA-binding transcriptional regulator/antitoxin component of YhaV-PrlF toxin-antitoxin module
LNLPKRIRRVLDLEPGSKVHVVVEVVDRGETTRIDDPLERIIGLCEGGPPDGAENHDQYLYGTFSR